MTLLTRFFQHALLPSLGAMVLSCSIVGCTTPAGNAATHNPDAGNTTNRSFTFGVWGDMPYAKSGDTAKMPAVLQSMNQSDIAFSIYDGDFKDGGSLCNDAAYTDTLAMFAQLEKPLVYVPGDNEWVDCHRIDSGGYDALERLAHLRRVMFASDASLGQHPMALEHQGGMGAGVGAGVGVGAAMVENVRFSYGAVVFVGLNIPGSNNGLIETEKDCTHKSARNQAACDAANAEYAQRDAANLAWLADSFHQAKQHHARGLVIVIQADIGFDLPETGQIDETQLPQFTGFKNFRNALVQLTEQFEGQVLLVHGDTHFFKVDKPLYSPTRLLPNFTRLETFGSPHLHWVKVRVEPDSQQVFHIDPVIVRHQP